MYNTIVKTYRDGSKQIIFATNCIFREPGWERVQVDIVNQNRGLTDIKRELWARTHADAVIDDLMARAEYDLDPDYDWHNLPVEEMTVGQLARLDDEDGARAAYLEKVRRESFQRAMRRARVKVRDYCLSTDMRWFCTFTIDGDKLDRYDIHAITKKLNRWLGNQVQRNGLAYVMVPELHKDGAVHFHGMMTDALRAVDSGTIIPTGDDTPRRPRSAQQRAAWLRDGGRIVYNLPDWPYGFTTALPVEGCYEKAVTYISKYISKGLRMTEDGLFPEKVGGRWYYSGGDLGTPGLEFVNIDPDQQKDAFGDSAHEVELGDQLPGVAAFVVWITPEGVPR